MTNCIQIHYDMKITIGIADDQLLFMKSLSALIDTFPGFEVILDGQNGEELCRKDRKAHV